MSSGFPGRIVFMFSGQGAQYYQMGAELYRTDPLYRANLELCARLAGDIGGRSLIDIIFSRPLEDSAGFDDLAETHPVLLAIGYSLAQALIARGIRPDLLLGYSLGETIAAVVAGALRLGDAFRLLNAHAALIKARAQPAALIAVLAPVPDFAMAGPLAGRCHVAAVNAASHCVLAVAEADIPAVTGRLDADAVTWMRLPVRYGFHSPLVANLEANYLELAAEIPRQTPRIPALSCRTGALVEDFSPGHFWSVTRGPILCRDVLERLSDIDGRVLVDCGPSGTLAAFARLVHGPGVPAFPAISQFGRNLETIGRIVEVAA